MPLVLTCPEFDQGATIPQRFTEDGANVSPALSWVGTPTGTRAFALVMEDPDAPAGLWVHWLVYDIPATQTSLPGIVPTIPAVEGGARQGKNSWGKIGYGGPAPPPGPPHRYIFRIYALSAATNLKSGVTRESLMVAIRGKVLGEASWMGKYGR